MTTHILECSSQGDRRFSALYAQVSIFANTQSSETHYQLAKRFGPSASRTPRDAEGRKPTHFQVRDRSFPLTLGPVWYDLLWVKYLDQHPDLVAYAATSETAVRPFSPGPISTRCCLFSPAVRLEGFDPRTRAFWLLRRIRNYSVGASSHTN